MRYTLTVATLPDGEMVRQYGRRASITLDSDSLGYPGNYGRSAWDDATTPRTDRPVTLLRTGPTPASKWGMCRVIRAARASFPHGPVA